MGVFKYTKDREKGVMNLPPAVSVSVFMKPVSSLTLDPLQGNGLATLL